MCSTQWTFAFVAFDRIFPFLEPVFLFEFWTQIFPICKISTSQFIHFIFWFVQVEPQGCKYFRILLIVFCVSSFSIVFLNMGNSRNNFDEIVIVNLIVFFFIAELCDFKNAMKFKMNNIRTYNRMRERKQFQWDMNWTIKDKYYETKQKCR